MEPEDFRRHRKALMGTSVVGFVLAASGEQNISWSGIDLSGTWVWIFLGIAHVYFMLMFWVCFGIKEDDGRIGRPIMAYSSNRKMTIGSAFSYNVPFAIGLFGAVNIVIQLLLILEKYVNVA